MELDKYRFLFALYLVHALHVVHGGRAHQALSAHHELHAHHALRVVHAICALTPFVVTFESDSPLHGVGDARTQTDIELYRLLDTSEIMHTHTAFTTW